MSCPNSIIAVNCLLTLDCDLFGEFRNRFRAILAGDTPPYFCDMVVFADGHQGRTPSITHMLKVIRFQARLFFIKFFDLLSFASQINKIRSSSTDIEIKIEASEYIV